MSYGMKDGRGKSDCEVTGETVQCVFQKGSGSSGVEECVRGATV